MGKTEEAPPVIPLDSTIADEKVVNENPSNNNDTSLPKVDQLINIPEGENDVDTKKKENAPPFSNYLVITTPLLFIESASDGLLRY